MVLVFNTRGENGGITFRGVSQSSHVLRVGQLLAEHFFAEQLLDQKLLFVEVLLGWNNISVGGLEKRFLAEQKCKQIPK